MAKRAKVTIEIEEDILDRLRDLHKQATVERSHYYVGKCCQNAIEEIERLRSVVENLHILSTSNK